MPAAAFSFGLALLVLSASFGHISGVHFNPSVTIGILIAGEMQAVMAILYIVMQLLGGKRSTSNLSSTNRIKLGIAAGGLLRLLLTTRTYASAACSGGATLLATYPEVNVTEYGRLVQHPYEEITIWQVMNELPRSAPANVLTVGCFSGHLH